MRKRLYLTGIFFFLLSIGIIVFFANSRDLSRGISSQEKKRSGFEHTVIDSDGPYNPWGKSVGDINGDGLLDLIVGGNTPRKLRWKEKILNKLKISKLQTPLSELVWYENPRWIKHIISQGRPFSTDHEVADIDGDSRNDVVSLTKTELLWFKNPDWSPFLIDSRQLHDVEVADLDGDGDIDIVARNQSAFGGSAKNLFFYIQDSPTDWRKFTLGCPNGEGLKIADMNGDGKVDVVTNGTFYINPGDSNGKGWVEITYSSSWSWEHTVIDVGDINADGRMDIVLVPAEKAGGKYHISWFEAPSRSDKDWQEHIVDVDVETVHHFVGTADMDNDGDTDIVSAEMHQGADPDEVKIYLNTRNGTKWTKKVLAITGSHNMRLADIDGDGDKDLFGANWSGQYQPVELWKNQACPPALDKWTRHVIDSQKPWRSVFVTSGDMDGDGNKDIVTGAWWYKNPSKASGKWKRMDIGDEANNMAVVYDFDRDGDLDVLATKGKGAQKSSSFVLAQNNGDGRFTVLNDIPDADGDFLQGVAIIQHPQGAEVEVALSWHTAHRGIQMFAFTKNPQGFPWSWRKLSVTSQDEQISAGDIDQDGDVDLLLGTKWLRNDGDVWTEFLLHNTDRNPDRNRLVDMNGDGRLDAVIGYEAISMLGKVAWYEQGGSATKSWKEHVIGKAIGPMSLDVADMDLDGDYDVVIGEHNLKNPATAKLIIFENVHGNAEEWKKHLVYTGDEHHDGAHVVDIDSDGDYDIVSIGWGHSKVILYENTSESCIQ